jgi:hypothetical protein
MTNYSCKVNGCIYHENTPHEFPEEYGNPLVPNQLVSGSYSSYSVQRQKDMNRDNSEKTSVKYSIHSKKIKRQ